MTAQQTVEAFIANWPKADRLHPSVREYFTADCRYENIGVSKTTGPEEAIAWFTMMSTLLTIPLMGIFKLRDGKICEWRDYFDTTPFKGG